LQGSRQAPLMGFPKGRAFHWQVTLQGPACVQAPGSPRGSAISAIGWNPQMTPPLSPQSCSSHHSQPSSPSSQIASSPGTPHSSALSPANGNFSLCLQTNRCTTPFTARSPSTPASNAGSKLQGSRAAGGLQHRSSVNQHSSRAHALSSHGTSGRNRGVPGIAPLSSRASVASVPSSLSARSHHQHRGYCHVPIVWANQQRLAHASSVSARADEADTYSLQPRARLRLQDLPTELFQHCLDLLPTFRDRARVCPACRASSELEWRNAPPHRATEELSGLRLGDKGVHAVAVAVDSAVKQHHVVRELSLGGNGIGNHGAKIIAALILGRNSAIRRLSLRDNCIGDEGAKSLAEALMHNTSLEELDIWGNCFGDVGKLALLSTAKCKVFLELDPPCVPLAVLTSEEETRRRTQDNIIAMCPRGLVCGAGAVRCGDGANA